VLDIERSRTRRERTFIGSECAVCEEPLEHTLRGERILQLSCGHVSHEACFYEYIREFESQHCPTCNATLGLDTSRGGNVLDLGKSPSEGRDNWPSTQHQARDEDMGMGADGRGTEKLSTIVRSVQHDGSQGGSHRSNQNTPTPWDHAPVPPEHNQYQQQQQQQQQQRQEQLQHHQMQLMQQEQQQRQQQQQQYQGRQRGDSDVSGRYPPSSNPRHRDSSHSRERMSDRMGSASRQHLRSDSGATGVTGVASSADYSAMHEGRRHDYDVQAMETSLSSPRSLLKSPIPAPTVTVRSEFPTLNRSRQQQSLTCLVTVEVVDGKWRPDPDDMRAAPPLPSIASQAESFARPKSPAPGRPQMFDSPYQSAEELDEITEDLHSRVDNWHGLDFSRFGKLRLHGHVRVGKDRQAWQELECYLFSEMLICVKEKKATPAPPQSQYPGAEPSPRKPKCTLKGSILIKKHLNQVEYFPDDAILTLSLSVAELPAFHLQFQNRAQLDLWRRALMDIRMDHFPQPGGRMNDYEQDNSGTEDDDYRGSRPQRVSSVNSSSYGAARSNITAPTEYTNSRVGGREPRISGPIHVPLDIVVVIPVSSSMQGLKINLLRDTLKFLVQNLGERDRMGLVTFGSSGGGVPIVGMTSKAWKDWPKVLDSIRPVGQKSPRADVVEGANVAMDLLMQRKSNNPLSSILLISDSSTSDAESVDFVVSRAEAAK
jgi:hypothetical protein